MAQFVHNGGREVELVPVFRQRSERFRVPTIRGSSYLDVCQNFFPVPVWPDVVGQGIGKDGHGRKRHFPVTCGRGIPLDQGGMDQDAQGRSVGCIGPKHALPVGKAVLQTLNARLVQRAFCSDDCSRELLLFSLIENVQPEHAVGYKDALPCPKRGCGNKQDAAKDGCGKEKGVFHKWGPVGPRMKKGFCQSLFLRKFRQHEET